METTARNTFLQTLLIVLAVHVTAFVIFHLNVGLIFDMWFVRLILAYEWPRSVYAVTHFLALYLPVAVFVWMAFSKRHNIPLLLTMIVITGYYAYRWHYPILTSFLFEIGQFETHGEFVMGNMPGLDQYPEFQSMEMSME